MLKIINQRKDILILCIIYAAAHGLSLLNQGLYWDDWIWYHLEPSLRMEVSRELGVPWGGYYSNFMFSLPRSVTIFRLIVFVSYLVSALCLNEILKKIKEITLEERLFITACFMLMPFNLIRMVISVSTYAIYICFFWLAMLLVSRYLETNKVYNRVLSYLFFFLCFNLNSLLVFYFLVFVFIAYHHQVFSSLRSLREKIGLIRSYADFLILPIVFWLCRSTLFKPNGIYKNYNTFQGKYILLTPFRIVTETFYSIFGLIDSSVAAISQLHWFSPTFVVVGLILLFTRVSRMESQCPETGTLKKDLAFTAFGVIAIMAALFPYLVVGHIPRFESYDSRHQILLPLGAAFTIVYGLRLLLRYCVPRKYGVYLRTTLILLVLLFSLVDMKAYWNLQKDWFKQAAIMENIRRSNDFQEKTVILFNDHLRTYTAWQREILPYEYTGYLRAAFGNEKRFGVDYDAFWTIPRGADIFTDDKYKRRYLLSEFEMKEPKVIVNIEFGGTQLTTTKVAKLLYEEWVKPSKFLDDVRGLVQLRNEIK